MQTQRSLREERQTVGADESVVLRSGWPRLVLSANERKGLAEAIEYFAETVSQEAMYCLRHLSRLGQRASYKAHADRLSRCRALGQHLRRPLLDGWEGQMGLYGTTAGLELLAKCRPATAFVAGSFDPCDGQLAQRWADAFLAVANFTHLVVQDFINLPESKYWEQIRTTLRICHLFRALAVADPVIKAFAHQDMGSSGSIVPAVLSTLPSTLTQDGFKDLAATLYTTLLDAKHSGRFCWGAGSREAPDTWGERLFMWGSVIVAIVRAHHVGLLDSAQAHSLCTVPELEGFVELVKGKRVFQDARYRLYALWALSHLTGDGCTSHSLGTGFRNRPGEFKIPSHLALGQIDREWLQEEITRTCGQVLDSEILLHDLHSPYHVFWEDDSEER